jgi:hypothetical protein
MTYAGFWKRFGANSADGLIFLLLGALYAALGSFSRPVALALVVPVALLYPVYAAGYLGLVSVLVLPAPLALFTGILGIRDIRRHPQKRGMGRSIFGVVMGALGTAALLFILAMMLVR